MKTWFKKKKKKKLNKHSFTLSLPKFYSRNNHAEEELIQGKIRKIYSQKKAKKKWHIKVTRKIPGSKLVKLNLWNSIKLERLSNNLPLQIVPNQLDISRVKAETRWKRILSHHEISKIFPSPPQADGSWFGREQQGDLKLTDEYKDEYLFFSFPFFVFWRTGNY